MEANYGGPVWHASVAFHENRPVPLFRLAPITILGLWDVAMKALDGVGDKALGSWTEEGTTAVHLRRRLAAPEWGDRPWGMDYRGTPAGDALLAENREWLPAGFRE